MAESLSKQVKSLHIERSVYKSTSLIWFVLSPGLKIKDSDSVIYKRWLCCLTLALLSVQLTVCPRVCFIQVDLPITTCHWWLFSRLHPPSSSWLVWWGQGSPTRDGHSALHPFLWLSLSLSSPPLSLSFFSHRVAHLWCFVLLRNGIGNKCKRHICIFLN